MELKVGNFGSKRERKTDDSLGYAGILEDISGEGCSGDVALWRAVITQALMDAGSNSRKPEMKFERAQAISWLAGHSPDFNTVCALADMSPQYVKEKAAEAIKRGCAWRQETLNEGRRKRIRINRQRIIEKKSLKDEEVASAPVMGVVCVGPWK